MNMKTSELQGDALDWAVAQCEGYFDIGMASVHDGVVDVFYFPAWQPSTDWAQGGPIIQREGINIRALSGETWEAETWDAGGGQYLLDGPTPLIAAMRCYVASKLGDEVEIPEVLK